MSGHASVDNNKIEFLYHLRGIPVDAKSGTSITYMAPNGGTYSGSTEPENRDDSDMPTRI